MMINLKINFKKSIFNNKLRKLKKLSSKD